MNVKTRIIINIGCVRLQKRAKNGWSGWSEWSTCSRSCDGGVAQQLRRCHAPDGCRGDPIRYRLCNMQVSIIVKQAHAPCCVLSCVSNIQIVSNRVRSKACPDMQDFRARQCSAFDDQPYDGQLYKWHPHYDYADPCALTCRGQTSHYPADEPAATGQQTSAVSDQHNQSDEAEPVVVAQLAKRVQDGTRCRPGSLDICIQGKCQVSSNFKWI